LNEQLNVRALVVGYGSIGRRHAQRLTHLGCVVAVCSRRNVDFEPSFTTIADAVKQFQPDYVVVSSRTSEHFGNLEELVNCNFSGDVLIEKPLFDLSVDSVKHQFRSAHVAYNFRHPPLIARLRLDMQNESICSFNAYVGQYLPSWRPETDYQKSYSASAAHGGGALRDLSHELDYTNWLLGGWTHVTAQGGKYSDLKITSDDCFSVLMSTARCDGVTVQMNYLDRKSRRTILVNTNQHTYHVDLLNGIYTVDNVDECVNVERDIVIDDMHKDILEGSSSVCATLEEGLDVMRLIQAVEISSKKREWIQC